MSRKNRRLLLVSRPQGEPTVDNFSLEEELLPDLRSGQVLVRHQYL